MRVLLGGQEVAEEDVPVGQGFFDDVGIAAVVGQGVAEGRGFGGALR